MAVNRLFEMSGLKNHSEVEKCKKVNFLLYRRAKEVLEWNTWQRDLVLLLDRGEFDRIQNLLPRPGLHYCDSGTLKPLNLVLQLLGFSTNQTENTTSKVEEAFLAGNQLYEL